MEMVVVVVTIIVMTKMVAIKSDVHLMISGLQKLHMRLTSSQTLQRRAYFYSQVGRERMIIITT